MPGLLSLSNIKKAEFSGYKAKKWFQMISNDPKFNLGQVNAYKLMFAIKLSLSTLFLVSSKWKSFEPDLNNVENSISVSDFFNKLKRRHLAMTNKTNGMTNLIRGFFTISLHW